VKTSLIAIEIIERESAQLNLRGSTQFGKTVEITDARSSSGIGWETTNSVSDALASPLQEEKHKLQLGRRGIDIQPRRPIILLLP
jgi:hypothetical protein